MKRKRFLSFFSILIIIVGLGILLYPVFSDYMNTKVQMKAISQYDDTQRHLPAKDLEDMLKQASEYNDNLIGKPVHDPFSINQGYVLSGDYSKILNPNNDGLMGTIQIPSIDVNLPIYHGCSDEVLKKGVGHIEGTSFPVGSKSSYCVLSGHRGLPEATLFTYLDRVKIGDEFYIKVLNKTFAYKVFKTDVVLPDSLNSSKPTEGKDIVVLVTCTPYGINSHRLLVYGERTEFKPEHRNNMAARATFKHIDMKYVVFGVCTGLLIIIAVIIIIRRRR